MRKMLICTCIPRFSKIVIDESTDVGDYDRVGVTMSPIKEGRLIKNVEDRYDGGTWGTHGGVFTNIIPVVTDQP